MHILLVCSALPASWFLKPMGVDALHGVVDEHVEKAGIEEGAEVDLRYSLLARAHCAP